MPRCVRTTALTFVALFAAGCTLGPDYARPTIDTPTAYRNADATSPAPTLENVSAWWTGFGDPQLDALVTEALAANHDLRIAALRVDEFAARARTTRAQAFPQVGYGATAGRQGIGDVSTGTYSAVLSARWELDLWGRVRRETEAARADLFATEEARRGIALTLVGTVVSGYVTLLQLDRQLAISEATVDGRKKNVDLFRVRLEGGAVSDFEFLQVQAEYEAALATLPDIRLAIAQQEHALSTLVGRNPGPIARGKPLEGLAEPQIAAELPSKLLERRPDILQAEQQLVSANALVGAARALYFPSVSLTGTGGTASNELDALFSGPARSWSFVGQLLGPLFAGGAIDAANAQAVARREQSVENYRATIQDAFRDVDDALAAIRESRELVTTLQRRVAALDRAVGLATERYDNGYADYFEVLDTERNLFNAQLSLANARGDGYRARTDLYRALGGDWRAQAVPAPDAVSQRSE
ncbi:RND transporter [Lysobacter helvus]|uniref:RND transporter n=2 Tax=Lysobacteraceae TaxID=32033 RepID=A0ABM7Q7C3_9GAMM|nr:MULTISPECIES: efflux transporter outer membrane subunit [Lysobacter]BCT93226.1 RND transporter [Lysobacter caseinilyticus]BCT96378.1 RND transporter [Lysobacter helvus]